MSIPGISAGSCFITSSVASVPPVDAPRPMMTLSSDVCEPREVTVPESTAFAAAAAELYELDLDQIEYAAEMSIEHHLGLTCDPILGLVQIPCSERNAIAAMRALNAVNLADFLADSRKISFDMIVKTMYETGKDLKVMYRETSEGGLAKTYSL